jgi:hypothetical protein
MTKPLSPSAIAVWEAFNQDTPGVFVDYGDCLAAAIQALADQVVPEPNDTDKALLSLAAIRNHCKVRDRFLAIAAELKAQ